MKSKSLPAMAAFLVIFGNLVALNATERPTGFISLGSRPLIALSNGETLLAHWSTENANLIGLIETESGKQRTGLRLPEPMKLLHLQFGHGSGYLYAVSDTGKVITWESRADPKIVQLEGISTLSGSVAIDRQEKRLVYGGTSNVTYQTGAVWDIGTGDLVHSWQGQPAIGAAFSQDGIRALLATKASIVAYDLNAGEESPVTELNEVAYQFQASPAGRYVSLVSLTRATILDTATMETDYVEVGPGAKVIFSPDDHRLVVAQAADRSRRVEVWLLRDGVSELSLEKEMGGRLADPVGVSSTALVFHTRESRNALRIEDFSELRHKLIGFDSRILQDVSGVGYDAAVSMLSINHDGTLIASGLAGQTVAVWTTTAPVQGFKSQTQRNAPRIPEMRATDRCLGMVKFAVAASTGQFVGNRGALLITFIDGSKGLLLTSTTFPQENLLTIRYRDWERHSSRELSDLDFSPRGDKLAVAVGSGVSIVDVSTGRELQYFPYASFFSKFDSRGEKVFCVGRSQHGVANLTTRNYISMRDFGQPSPRTTGGRLATGVRIQGDPVVLDLDAARQVRTFQGREVRNSGRTSVSEDGGTFILGGTVKRPGRQETVQLEIFDVDSGDLKVSMETESPSVRHLFVLNNSQIAVLGTRHRLAIYDTRRRRILQVIPDEKYRDDGKGELTETRTIDQLRQENRWWLDLHFMLAGHPMYMDAVDVRESADRLLIAEYSRASVWRLSTGELLWMGDMPSGDLSVVRLSPDGKMIAIGKKSGDVHLQRVP